MLERAVIRSARLGFDWDWFPPAVCSGSSIPTRVWSGGKPIRAMRQRFKVVKEMFEVAPSLGSSSSRVHAKASPESSLAARLFAACAFLGLSAT